ncbi:MAG: aspartate aminotransferase family protein [Halobacteriovorax sp.]|nr:aspartate aminotransferase family protein [Halobacteriovorax sp.]
MLDNHKELFELSKKIIPGGVHSPVRGFKGLPMAPRFFERAEGAYITDVAGKDYIDFCMSFGPLILGHRDRDVEQELRHALERGWSYGACEPYSLKLAQFLVDRLPFIDQIRFVNSGTEAVMTAIRLARGYTKRSKIIKFNGCYHGHVDSMLIKAGSGLAGSADASSAGVPKGVSDDTLIVELNDIDALKACFEEHKDEIAGVFIEPLPANNGLLIQDNEYLHAVRDLCTKEKALLVFDEVISGFRVAFGGMAKVTGIKPDLVTYGKIIGGGLPVGAIGGPEHIMSELAPVGPVYQAGTLSANPLAMVGGLATLSKLSVASYDVLEANTKRIADIFRRWLAEYSDGKYANTSVIQYGSLFWMHPKTDKELKAIHEIPSNLSEAFGPMFGELLEKGIYIAPNAWEVGFASMAHDDAVIAELEKRLWS